MITITLDARNVLDALQQLSARTTDLRPALIEIGEKLASSTMARFASGTAPDGTPWQPNSPVTIRRYELAGQSGKKPLVGATRNLGTGISWQLRGNDAVEVGSAEPYAAMQQFGGSKAAWPHLWGDIPARPYLGLSVEDERDILDIVAGYLAP